MASKPVEIKVTGKTQEFTRAVDKGVVDPLQEAQEALKDVQKQSDKTSESLVDDMKAAQKATEKLEDENKTLADTIAKGSKKAYKQMGDAAEVGTHKAVDATQDFKDEARQNFSEVTSSFDGSMDSVADLAQGTFGGLAATGGPVGLAAGALAAVGGLVYAGWKNATEQSAAVVQEMYDDMLESGLDYLSDDYKMKQYYELLQGKSAIASAATLDDIAKQTGLTRQEVALAFAGDTEAMTKVQEKLTTSIADTNAALQEGGNPQTLGPQRTHMEDLLHLTEGVGDTAQKTASAVAADRAGWQTWGTTAAKEIQKVHTEQGKVLDRMGTIKQAATTLPTKTTVKVALDTTAFDNGLRALKNGNVKIPVTMVTRDGRKIL